MMGGMGGMPAFNPEGAADEPEEEDDGACCFCGSHALHCTVHMQLQTLTGMCSCRLRHALHACTHIASPLTQITMQTCPSWWRTLSRRPSKRPTSAPPAEGARRQAKGGARRPRQHMERIAGALPGAGALRGVPRPASPAQQQQQQLAGACPCSSFERAGAAESTDRLGN